MWEAASYKSLVAWWIWAESVEFPWYFVSSISWCGESESGGSIHPAAAARRSIHHSSWGVNFDWKQTLPIIISWKARFWIFHQRLGQLHTLKGEIITNQLVFDQQSNFVFWNIITSLSLELEYVWTGCLQKSCFSAQKYPFVTNNCQVWPKAAPAYRKAQI